MFNMLGCLCNGKADLYGQGGECTDGKNGRWCYVNKDACSKQVKYKGKFFSRTPCWTELNPTKPCVCSGTTYILGLGRSCRVVCYVDKDANCTDITSHNGKPASRNACKCNKGKLY